MLQNRRQVQLVLAGDVDQFVIRDAAPDQEREARGQFQIGDAIRLARVQFAGSRSARMRNCGLVRIRRSPSSIPSSKLPSCGLLDRIPAPIPNPRPLRTPVGSPHQSGQDLLGAGVFLALVGRTAGEDFAEGGRIERTRWSERALDSQDPDRRIILQLRNADCPRAISSRTAGSYRATGDNSPPRK